MIFKNGLLLHVKNKWNAECDFEIVKEFFFGLIRAL